MKPTRMLAATAILSAFAVGPGFAEDSEPLVDYQMNEAKGTEMSGLTDSGTAKTSFKRKTKTVVTNGEGQLIFKPGESLYISNSSDLNIKSGQHELTFSITDAKLAGGSPTGANVGLAIKDNDGGVLMIVRLFRLKE